MFYLHSGEDFPIQVSLSRRFYVDYENQDFEGKRFLGMRVTGQVVALNLLVNSIVDPKTLSVLSFDKWRGVGDASSSGRWLFKDGEFILSTFGVHASYDEEITRRWWPTTAPKTVLSETP